VDRNGSQPRWCGYDVSRGSVFTAGAAEVHMQSRFVRLALTLAAFFGTLAPRDGLAQGQQGSVTGRVTDAASGAPIGAAQVAIVGTTLGTQTNTEGQYTIRGVTPGQVEVRVLRLGFGEQRQAVTVVAGQAATLNFQM